MAESKVEEEKEKLLYSESYPLNENNERPKVKPVSSVHKLLSGVQLDLNKIYYKPLVPEHYEEVKNLHKEWFPVPYDEQFFVNSILNNQGYFITEGAFYFLEEENKEIILGLIICQWTYIEKYFIDMVGENVFDKINNEIDYEEEAQFYLSKQKFYSSLYVMTLGVIDECRKMNIGTNLIKDTMNYVITFPFCTCIYLNVITDNFSGKKFYEKNGLICAKRIKNYYNINDKQYDSDVYIKIFNKKEKNSVKKYRLSMMNRKEKFYYYFILKPYYFLVKLFLIFCLCRFFQKKIKINY